MALDFSYNGYEALFKKALLEGINLFCGAGFSVEACDAEGNRLPVGAGLLTELKSEFPTVQAFSNLSRACTKITRTDKGGFYRYLENRFSVASFNPLYYNLRNVQIRNVYTTNIDDLFFNIYEQSDQPFYLNDRSIKGETYQDTFAIHYFPLHGCIRDKERRDYVFGATDIASAFSQRGNEKSWRSLAKDAASHPILFWGWNFDDAGPIEAMYGNENHVTDNINRWVLLYHPDEETINYLQSLKFNIIIGDTIDMLEYIRDLCTSDNYNRERAANFDASISEALKDFSIPENNDTLPTYPLRTLFENFVPRWSHIYSHEIPKTTCYAKVAECIASNQNVFVFGIRGCGKTTLMMQLLAQYETIRPKHYLVAPSMERVDTYIRLSNGQNTLLFVDDCFRDTNAIIKLLNQNNIQVICFDRDFNYERQFHKIDSFDFRSIDITEITQEDAQSIINIIPTDLRKTHYSTKKFQNDPTILSLLALILKPLNWKFVRDFIKQDLDAARVFIMIAYVHACGTPCSFDMVYSYLGDDLYNWKEMLELVGRSGGHIQNASSMLSQYNYNIEESLQDYYRCRSRFFAEKMIQSIPHGDETFANVLRDFAKYVPPFKICHYDKFKRSAYDADFAYRAFTTVEDGEEFYQWCSEKDQSEYIYQQAALYFWRMNDNKRAFHWIEKARNLSHYNRFSIDSTYSQIYFDVNLKANEEQAALALDMLQNCCTNDKRKSIHFNKFAECSLRFHQEYSNERSAAFVRTALGFIDEGIEATNRSLGDTNKRKLKQLKKDLNNALR